MALWRAGLDFDHGTGHGVGSYLSVHEGPQRLAKTGTTALAPGMIVSNEPGYYAAGAFGIRIENLVAVETRTIAGGERPMLGFETLTLAPIDLALVEPKLLDADEIAWLDDYHAPRAQDVVAARRRADPPLAHAGDAASRRSQRERRPPDLILIWPARRGPGPDRSAKFVDGAKLHLFRKPIAPDARSPHPTATRTALSRHP